MKRTITFGQVLDPDYHYDFESALRLHSLLVQRSLRPEWRFKTEWVTTGPFEALMGSPGCGSSSGGTSAFDLLLLACDGVDVLTKKVQRQIYRTLCRYPEFAQLSERMPDRDFHHVIDGMADLSEFEGARTVRQMNQYHAGATLIKNVGLMCTNRGVVLTAKVGFSRKKYDSEWSLFQLARQKPCCWNETQRLTTFLNKCVSVMRQYAKTSNSGRPK